MPKYGVQRRSLRSRWRLCRLTDAACPLRVVTALYGGIQPHKGTGAPRATLTCHCEERSDVAISGRHSQSVQAAVKTYRRNRFVRFYRCPVLAASADPGLAVRSPTARGWEPSCNSLFLIPPAWAGEWSGRSRDPSPPASSPPGCPHCGRARGCDSRCSGTAAHPAR